MTELSRLRPRTGDHFVSHPVRVVASVVIGLAVVLVASGVYVAVAYRPDAAGFTLGVQRIHGLAGTALVIVAVAWLVVALAGRIGGLVGASLVAGVALVVAWVLGGRIAWDQVGIVEMLPGDRVRGVLLTTYDLRFVRTDGHQYAAATYRGMLAMHAIVLPTIAAVATGWAMWVVARPGRGRSSAVPGAAGERPPAVEPTASSPPD